jgi:hypothetical protein
MGLLLSIIGLRSKFKKDGEIYEGRIKRDD